MVTKRQDSKKSYLLFFFFFLLPNAFISIQKKSYGHLPIAAVI